MTPDTLFVSLWKIALPNLPEGNFRHRVIEVGEACQRIDDARSSGTLHCVCSDDLLAPFRKRELEKHTEFCGVLASHFGIALSLEDFCTEHRDDEGGLHFVQPLELAEVKQGSALLVVTCGYRMEARHEGKRPAFAIEPSSVAFHVFEAL